MVKQTQPSASNDNTKLTPTPTAYNGPWMKAETLARIPDLSRDFQMSRDPFIAAQVRDLDKSERQRRDESGDTGAPMVRKDKPQPAPRPPAEIARKVDAASFNGRWLAAQYEAARASAHPPRHPPNSPYRSMPAPDRGPKR